MFSLLLCHGWSRHVLGVLHLVEFPWLLAESSISINQFRKCFMNGCNQYCIQQQQQQLPQLQPPLPHWKKLNLNWKTIQSIDLVFSTSCFNHFPISKKLWLNQHSNRIYAKAVCGVVAALIFSLLAYRERCSRCCCSCVILVVILSQSDPVLHCSFQQTRFEIID